MMRKDSELEVRKGHHPRNWTRTLMRFEHEQAGWVVEEHADDACLVERNDNKSDQVEYGLFILQS